MQVRERLGAALASAVVWVAGADPVGEGDAARTWQPVAQRTAWRDEGYRLHGQSFLRVRSWSTSTSEGFNRALLEFACPVRSVGRVELWLEGRDTTGAMVVVRGYAGDGVVTADDAERSSEVVAVFEAQLGRTVIDVSQFVTAQSARGATHVGFRLELAGESVLPRGLNVRAGWKANARLVVYPTCYADCDTETGLNVLDAFDFLCFQQEFLAQSAYACNCDTASGRGVCDIYDFLCFQRRYLDACRVKNDQRFRRQMAPSVTAVKRATGPGAGTHGLARKPGSIHSDGR